MGPGKWEELGGATGVLGRGEGDTDFIHGFPPFRDIILPSVRLLERLCFEKRKALSDSGVTFQRSGAAV